MTTTHEPPNTEGDAVPAPTPLPLEEAGPGGRRLSDSQPTTFMGKVRDNLYYMRGRGALEISAVFAALLIVFVVWSGIDPVGFPFLEKSNLSGVLSQSIPVLAILAIGAGVLMIAGEFDLSIGAVIGLCAVVFIKIANEQGSWVIGFVAALLAGIGAMTINGLIVVLTRIPSFIATLGMSFFWTGASIFINGLQPATFAPGVRTETMVNIFAADFGYVRSQIFWLVGVGTAAWFFLHRHKAGNKVYAVGGNASAAAAVSIKPKVVKLQAFALLGLMVGIASSLIVARTSGMQPGTTEDYLLLTIAAAVVGGCSLTGGRGTIFGMCVGAALIITIQNVLILAQAPGFYVQLFLGLAIVVAAIFNKFMEGKAT